MSESTCAIATYSSSTSEEQRPQSSPRISESSTVPLYELQSVIQQYQAHPELLKLILTSKVEEDKRRAEEAKLRTKELDYYLKYDSPPPPPSPSSPVQAPTQAPLLPPIQHQQQEPSKQQRKMSIPSHIMTQPKDRYAPYTKPTVSSQQQPPDSPLSPSRKNSFDDHQQRRHSAATAMLAMGRSVSPCTLPTSPSSPDQPHYPPSDEEMDISSATHAYPSPVMDTFEEQDSTNSTSKPRRRREMQAITKIVETRDFPYMDQYFWRNNGNTTQKKTGCRSIYYKCSNSNKGCQVNKTVTAKQNGEYLIKYRGTHLQECGMVERIRDL